MRAAEQRAAEMRRAAEARRSYYTPRRNSFHWRRYKQWQALMKRNDMQMTSLCQYVQAVVLVRFLQIVKRWTFDVALRVILTVAMIAIFGCVVWGLISDTNHALYFVIWLFIGGYSLVGAVIGALTLDSWLTARYEPHSKPIARPPLWVGLLFLPAAIVGAVMVTAAFELRSLIKKHRPHRHLAAATRPLWRMIGASYLRRVIVGWFKRHKAQKAALSLAVNAAPQSPRPSRKNAFSDAIELVMAWLQARKMGICPLIDLSSTSDHANGSR